MTELNLERAAEELRHIPRSILIEHLWRILGLQSHPEVRDVTIGTSSVLVLKNSPNRIGWTIVNHSASVIYLGFNAEISAGSGFYLSPSGGSLQFKALDDGAMVIDEIWGISAGAGLTVSVIEVVIDDVRKG